EADSGPVGNGPHAALVPHLGHAWWVVAAVPALLFALWVARPVGRGAGGVGDGGVSRVGTDGGRGVGGVVDGGGGARESGGAASLMGVVLIAGALVAEVVLAWHLAMLLA